MSTTNSGPSGDNRRINNGVLDFLRSDYVNTALYCVRIGTIFCCLAFFFAPLFSNQHHLTSDSWYRKALLASATTSALRLHQRMKTLNTGFSRAILTFLAAEDSLHYLMYSVMFAILPPITVTLMPVFLFALLHVSSFTQTLLNTYTTQNQSPSGDGAGSSSQPSYFHNLIQMGITKVKTNDQIILRVIALNEIMLMIVCIFMALSGPKILFLPFIYYPFLKMRYNSRRNPYSKYQRYHMANVLNSIVLFGLFFDCHYLFMRIN